MKWPRLPWITRPATKVEIDATAKRRTDRADRRRLAREAYSAKEAGRLHDCRVRFERGMA